MDTRTSVVNVKHEAFDVYIGRTMPGYAGSKFANPFKRGVHGNRAEVLEKYRAYVQEQPALMAALEELRGKRLGCWCKPYDCHGDILVELLEGPPPPAAQGSLF